MCRFLASCKHLWLPSCLAFFSMGNAHLLAQRGGVAHQTASAEAVYLDDSLTLKKGLGFLCMPHLTAVDGSFTTVIEVVNIHSFSANFTMIGYDAQGNSVSTVTGTAGPRKAFALDPVNLFGNDQVSHVRVTAPNLDVAAVYSAKGIYGSAAQVSARYDTGDFWVVPLGNPDLTYDGLAVVNLDEADATIMARFLDMEGNLLQEQILREGLAPLGKHLTNLTTFAPEGSHSVEITGDRQLALTALRGDFQSRFLWENQTVAYQSQGLIDPCGTGSLRREGN